MNDSMKWLDNLYTRFYVSQHYEDWDERIFARYDIGKMKEYWSLVDPDVVILSSLTHNGKLLCNLEGYGNRHKGLKGVDQLAEMSGWAREHNKKVVAYVSTIYDKEQYDAHPEWRQVDPNGKPLLEGSFGKIVCPNSEYRQYLMQFCTDLLRQYRLDGVLLDMVFFEEMPCYCGSCRRLYRERYGTEMPARPDWSDPDFRELVRFRIESNYRFALDIYQTIKTASPETAVANQYLLLKDTNRAVGQSLALGSVPDYFYSDVYFGWGGFLQMTVCTKALVAAGRNRPEMGIMVRPGSHDDTPHMKTSDHLMAEAFTIIANGGTVHMFDIIWPDGTMQEALLRRVRSVFDEIRLTEPYLGGRAMKSVAVFYSENSRIWYGEDDRENRYDQQFFGACRILVEQQVIFNIVTRLTAEQLDGYDALVLPNAACLDDDEVAVIRGYVSAGGGLVCTGRTSLYDGNGGMRKDFALADVMGLTRRGDTSEYSRVFARYDTASEIARALPDDGFVACWGPVEQVELTTGNALSRVHYPITEPTDERFVNIMANPPAVPTEWPASVHNRHGDGQVVSFLHHIDRDYLRLSFPELRQLVTAALGVVRRKAARVSVIDGPLSVELNVFEKPDEHQWVVHLVNLQPETGRNHVSSSPTRSYGSQRLAGTASRQQLQKILPVVDLVLRLEVSEEQVQSVRMEPSGDILEAEPADGGLLVKVPRLSIHSLLVVQLID